MDRFRSKMLGLFIICMSLQDGCGLPLSDLQETLVSEPHPRHIRTKRCSCSNWEDRECIYFCHLDIIWVNTPSKLLPYGLGSSASRRRRSASRCECRDPADKTCRGFCHKNPEDGRTEVLQKSYWQKQPQPSYSFKICGQAQHGNRKRYSVIELFRSQEDQNKKVKK